MKLFFLMLLVVFSVSCNIEQLSIKYTSPELQENKINLNAKTIKVYFTGDKHEKLEISKSEIGVKDFISTLFNKNSQNDVLLKITFDFNNFTYIAKENSFDKASLVTLIGVNAGFLLLGTILGIYKVDTYNQSSDSYNTAYKFDINNNYANIAFAATIPTTLIGLTMLYYKENLIFNISGKVTIDICDIFSENVIHTYSKEILINTDKIYNTTTDNEDFNKLLKPVFSTIKDDIISENETILKKYSLISGFKITSKEKADTNKKIPVMLKLISKNIEIDDSIVTLFRSSVEDILTKNTYSLINEEVQNETLKEQAEQRKKECYDESCIVDVGKMLAARWLIIIDIVKIKTNYMFKLKYINLETAETIKTKMLVYKEDINDIEELFNFAKLLIIDILN